MADINSFIHDCSRGFSIIFDGENGDITITHLIWVLQWSLQLHISQKRHMRLVISELLNSCRFTHLVIKGTFNCKA
jgi:hypothetical protein